MNQYELVLRNDKRRQYDQFAFFIILINLVIFGCFALLGYHKENQYKAALVVLVLTGSLLLNRFSKQKAGKGRPYLLGAFLVTVLSWVWFQQWWIALACLVLGVFYQLAKRELVVKFEKEQIIYPSFPEKNIAWNQLNNALLKDGLLTIDFKNDRIIQQLIENSVNEKEFNEFCSQQLNA